MEQRITVSLTPEGMFEIYMNEAGRDALISALSRLNERNDHAHLGPDDSWELQLGRRAYDPDNQVIQYGKLYFRLDKWDREHYPHVIGKD